MGTRGGLLKTCMTPGRIRGSCPRNFVSSDRTLGEEFEDSEQKYRVQETTVGGYFLGLKAMTEGP